MNDALLPLDGIPDGWLAEFIAHTLAEDLGDGDHTTRATIPAGTRGSARCLVKSPGVLAGAAFAQRVFRHLDPSAAFTLRIPDGSPVSPGDEPFHVQAGVHALLSGERLVLNTMQRLSGIATMAHRATQLVAGTGCRVLDTRKTTPGMRHLEKWAVRMGGAHNHRFGLFDMVLVKDNHVDFAGGIAPALAATRSYLATLGRTLPVEIETRNLDEVRAVLDHGTGLVQRVLLDNMSLDTLRAAVALIGGTFETEASGGVTLDNLAEIARTGVSHVSLGALTHSAGSLDISLKALS